ncbi:hypothetical protein HPB47_014718 [Ixodes persulcatus]|uniref:Uncharacterized protein n=1 Tax=Ixodes persulcatus TaxID=34615 RepID=A0AC60QVA1_IXOPE|nr:hypothetical protein HPB47_014718 [Ixodes persulcatus]
MTATSLKLLGVHIPARAEEGGSVRLHCTYDLEGQAPLSTSWYKDDVLFYKFLESGGMAYPFHGADVNNVQRSVYIVPQCSLFMQNHSPRIGVSETSFASRVPCSCRFIFQLQRTPDMSSADLRLVSVDVPPYALLGGSAKLRCRFELGNASLYSVKWYKGHHEIFRYVPNEQPPEKVFPLRGVTVAESDVSSVLLEQLTLSSGGPYRCEVSGGAPFFHQVSRERDLNVIALPEEGPRIKGAQTHYDIGDTVGVNCFAPASKPGVNFRWFLNELPAEPPKFDITNLSTLYDDGLESSASRIRFVISEEQFVKGTASIKCVAEIPGMYMRAYATIIRRRSDGVGTRAPIKAADDDCLKKLISVIRKQSGYTAASSPGERKKTGPIL